MNSLFLQRSVAPEKLVISHLVITPPATVLKDVKIAAEERQKSGKIAAEEKVRESFKSNV